MRLVAELTRIVFEKSYLQKLTEESVKETLCDPNAVVLTDKQKAEITAKAVVDYLLQNELIDEKTLEKFEGCKG